MGSWCDQTAQTILWPQILISWEQISFLCTGLYVYCGHNWLFFIYFPPCHVWGSVWNKYRRIKRNEEASPHVPMITQSKAFHVNGVLNIWTRRDVLEEQVEAASVRSSHSVEVWRPTRRRSSEFFRNCHRWSDSSLISRNRVMKFLLLQRRRNAAGTPLSKCNNIRRRESALLSRPAASGY